MTLSTYQLDTPIDILGLDDLVRINNKLWLYKDFEYEDKQCLNSSVSTMLDC